MIESISLTPAPPGPPERYIIVGPLVLPDAREPQRDRPRIDAGAIERDRQRRALHAAEVDARLPAEGGLRRAREGQKRGEGEQRGKSGPPGRGNDHIEAERSGHGAANGAVASGS